MELDNNTKLRRFCFLGSFESVYVHLRGIIDVSFYWPLLNEICLNVDDTIMLKILKEVLLECRTVRHDEPLFVYAVYLASGTDAKWKVAVRKEFPTLITNDNDLFLFCKYDALIRKETKRKLFSKPARKAITSWYVQQSPDALKDMWLTRRGAHGFTHRILIKLCRLNDQAIGDKDVVKIFFKTCKQLTEGAESCPGLASLEGTSTISSISDDISDAENQVRKNNGAAPQNAAPEIAIPEIPLPQNPQLENPAPRNAASHDVPPNSQLINRSMDTADSIVQKPEIVKFGGRNIVIHLPESWDIVTAMAKLRTTKSKHEALQIILKFKLTYDQVPPHLLRFSSIMYSVLTTMPYLQLLKYWRLMGHHNHFKHPYMYRQLQNLMENKEKLHIGNIHPIVFLMQMRRMGMPEMYIKLAPKKIDAFKMPYINMLYKQCFGQNKMCGLRMHISMNFQANYKKKLLRNHKKITYFDAAVALAFGYFKRESKVDLYRWTEEKMIMEPVNLDDSMDIQRARDFCDKLPNTRNAQRLIAAVLDGIKRTQIYDIFLCIVPTAGRGNPKQNSELLSRFMDKYREVRNPNIKLVILDLLKYKKSMRYSVTHNEQILEICGLDEHTTDIIENFAMGRF